MIMKCDIYVQKNTQTDTGSITREWNYNQTISCFIQSMKSGGPFKGDTKTFIVNQDKQANPYREILNATMLCQIPLSKRWRVSSVRTSDGSPVFVDPDRLGNPDVIFEVTGSHPIMDPFGKISHYHVDLERVQVQNNDKTSP